MKPFTVGFAVRCCDFLACSFLLVMTAVVSA